MEGDAKHSSRSRRLVIVVSWTSAARFGGGDELRRGAPDDGSCERLDPKSAELRTNRDWTIWTS